MSDASLQQSNRTYHEAQSRMEMLPNYYRWMYRHIMSVLNGTVVELGCGAGLGIPYYLDRVERIYAIDHNEALLDRIRERFPSDKVQPMQLDLLDDWRELSSLQADTMVMMDVVEHFKDDEALIRNAASVIKSGGHLAIKVPAQAALFSDIDVASGHYRRYDKGDLLSLLEKAGLDVQSIRPFNPIGALAYRLKRHEKQNFSKTFSPQTLRLINMAVPLLSLSDHATCLPGQSWIGIFRKP